MKKMNFASITAGLDTLKDVMQQNAEIAQDKKPKKKKSGIVKQQA